MNTPIRWICAFFVCAMGSAQNMNIRTYNVDHGLPQGQVVSIHRDPSGYLWAGTYSGVARYDGRNWTVFGRKQGLPGNHVTAIFTDTDGTLWAGTFGQGLAWFDGERFHGFDPNTPEGSCVVKQFTQDHRNRIWAATSKGLFIIRNKQLTHLTQGLPHVSCRSVYPDKMGLVYVGTKSGLAAVVDDKVQRLPFGRKFDGLDVTVVANDGDRRLWVGTAKGLYYVEGNHVVPVEHPQLQKAHITSSVLESENGIWFGTRRYGAFKFLGTQIKTALTPANGLANTWVHSLFYDEEATLWLGTDSGLCKYRPSEFLAVNRQHGLGNLMCRTMFLDNDILWIGTRNGIYQVTRDFKVSQYDTSSFPSQAFYAIDRLGDGTMMFVSDSTLVLQKDGNTQFFGANAGVNTTAFRAGIVDKNDRIWVGGDGLQYLDNGQFIRMPDDHELYNVRTLNLVQDDGGTLWAGTSNGLVGIDPVTLASKVAEPRVSIWDLDIDSEGNIWVATNGRGLWRYDGQEYTYYNSENSDLANDFVWLVLAAENGHIWAGHNQGIDRLDGTNFTHYTKSDGLVDNEGAATSVVEDPKGRIYFGTGAGFSVFIAGEEQREQPPPRVSVSHVEVADETGIYRPVASNAVLSNRDNNLTFNFAGLSFIKEESINYMFKLDGQDPNWSEPTTLGEVRYMNLAPNQYEMRIKARNGNGPWSKETLWPFQVEPAFYQTKWFRAISLLVLITLVLFYIRTRLTMVRRRNRELEILVQQRTEALAQKGREFRELSLSDPLTHVRNRRYVSETMREEMSRLKRRYFRFQDGDPFTCLGVVLLDLDYFKSVNDRYGHDAGDTILVETAERLKATVRESDVVARWGGEEFLILYREVHPDDLPEMVLKLLSAIREEPYNIGNGRELARTTSAGFAYLHPALVQRDVPWEWALKMADLALFKAKEAGRDKAFGVLLNQEMGADSWFQATREEPDKSLEGEAFEMITLP